LLEQKLDEAPWTTRQTFAGVFFTLVPWVVFALVISLFTGQSGSTRPLSSQQDLISAIVTFLFSSLIEAAFLIAPFYFALHAYDYITSRRERIRLALGALGFRRFPIVRTLLWIVFFFFLILAVNILYQYVLTTFHLNLQTNDQYILKQSKSAPLSTYATLIAAVFVAPFCEEVFFRGFVFPGLLRGMSLGWATVLSALLFAVAHADAGSFAVLFVIGLALAFLRWRLRSIWPCILLHLLNNGISALVIVLTILGVLR